MQALLGAPSPNLTDPTRSSTCLRGPPIWSLMPPQRDTKSENPKCGVMGGGTRWLGQTSAPTLSLSSSDHTRPQVCLPPLNPAKVKDWGAVERTRGEVMEPPHTPTTLRSPDSSWKPAGHCSPLPPLQALAPLPWLPAPLAAPGDGPAPVLSLGDEM